jgi:hypothetical protein
LSQKLLALASAINLKDILIDFENKVKQMAEVLEWLDELIKEE